jgi:hypothetical protein
MDNAFVQLFLKLIPPALTILATIWGGPHVGVKVDAPNLMLSAVLGFAISLFVSAFKLERISARTEQEIEAGKELQIYVIHRNKELEAIVQSLYETDGGVIYSTSINYTPEDIKSSDSRKSDWASKLYTRPDGRTQFNRIVSVLNERDREWVRNMIQQKHNPNYDLRVVEDVPGPVLFPNLVIVQKGQSYRLFMSYRANAASGRFSFVTQNKEFAEGIWQYVTRFHSSLPRAEVCIEGWDLQKTT